MRRFAHGGKRLLFLLPAPLALLALRIGALHPEWIETHFSRKIYPQWATRLSRLTAIWQGPLAEKLLLLVVACFGICLLTRVIQSLVRREPAPMLRCLYRTICGLGALYAIFVLSWGLHFARLPFAEANQLEVRVSDAEELSALCNALLDDALVLRAQAQVDSCGSFALSESLPEMLQRIPLAFDALAQQYPFMAGQYAPPKAVGYNMALSEMQIMGIYIPFTGEALLNPGIPATQLAHTAAHEAAHQRGFAREAEADFVGYLACKASDDPALAYSGTLTMLRYAALSLSEADPEAYSKLARRFSEDIDRDYAQQYAYWQSFDTPIAGLISLTNERYLRTFALKTGEPTQLGDVVALLLAHFRQEHEH